MYSLAALKALPVADELSFLDSERDINLFQRGTRWGRFDLPGWKRSSVRLHGSASSALFYERELWAISGVERRTILNEAQSAYDEHLEERQAELGATAEHSGSESEFEPELHGTSVLRERLLRFPSAPVYALSPLDRRRSEGRPAGFHSFRVLDRAERPQDEAPNRIYLFHHGLDELPGMEFYYLFAGWLLANDRTSICIMRPFPGHMTRFPVNHRLAEKPLDRYLDNSGDLFRHYLRYMIETQWLLSCLCPRPRYDTLAGAGLLATMIDSTDPDRSRQNSEFLAEKIRAEFQQLLKVQRSHFAETSKDLPTLIGAPAVRSSVEALRLATGWRPCDHARPPQPRDVDRPTVHVVGYSLGGFVAQSAFMTWPFVIASCTTICSGGALRDLAPTAFSHPEEWQTLIHSMRYWLDKAMMAGSFGEANGRVLGLQGSFFHYLLRIFYEIFEQDFRSSYQTRESEYLQRLLYVVGGNDPIVKPRTVLDAAPQEGANIISIADMSHFLASAQLAQGTYEVEQRTFWLPEVARIVGHFAGEADRVYQRTMAAAWRREDNKGFIQSNAYPIPKDQVSEQDRFQIGADGSLAWPIFERFLDSLIARTELRQGFLFILRNDIPAWMLPPEYQIYRAKALHHSDDRIRAYLEGMAWKRDSLLKIGKGVIVIVPVTAIDRLRQSYTPGYAPVSAEVPMGEFMLSSGRAPATLASETVASFEADWARDRPVGHPQLWYFYPGEVQLHESGHLDGVINASIARRSELEDMAPSLIQHSSGRGQVGAIVTRLPDIWMFLDSSSVLSTVYKPADWKPSSSGDRRPDALTALVTRAARAFIDSQFETDSVVSVENWQSQNLVGVLGVSRSRNNPRYRGKLIAERKSVERAIVHAAVAALRSKLVTPQAKVG